MRYHVLWNVVHGLLEMLWGLILAVLLILVGVLLVVLVLGVLLVLALLRWRVHGLLGRSISLGCSVLVVLLTGVHGGRAKKEGWEV